MHTNGLGRATEAEFCLDRCPPAFQYFAGKASVAGASGNQPDCSMQWLCVQSCAVAQQTQGRLVQGALPAQQRITIGL